MKDLLIVLGVVAVLGLLFAFPNEMMHLIATAMILSFIIPAFVGIRQAVKER